MIYNMGRPKKEKLPKPPTLFKEKKDFLSRMVTKSKTFSYPREMKFAKDIFNLYPVEFLNLVKPPFELNSLAYLVGREGKKYLDLKFKEFQFKSVIIVSEQTLEKVGEDLNIKLPKTLIDFLK